MLQKLDIWLGKTIFIPPIVEFCHLTRQTPAAVSRLLWFTALLVGIYNNRDSVSALVIWTVFALVMIIPATLHADAPAKSWGVVRLLVSGMLLLTGYGFVAGVEPITVPIYWIIIMFAEYAATIQTLPPRDTREKRRKAADQLS